MCGRYLIITNPDEMRRQFGYPDQPNFPPRYNVAPTQPVPIVRVAEGQRHFALVRWGLMPPWVKDPKAFTLLINARGESVADKPAFRYAMRRRRCLFPADGFYEWKVEGGRRRAFHARKADGGGLLAFAGLWEVWTGPNGEEMETAAIVTSQANREMATVHHRAPVIVPPEQFDLWLGGEATAAAAVELIAPAPDGSMEVYEVSPAVNRAIHDAPELIARYTAPPVTETPAPAKPARKPKKDDRQPSLF